jgi:hypothetical protein
LTEADKSIIITDKMASYRITRFIQISFVLLVVVLIIVGIGYVGRLLFFSGNSSSAKTDTSRSALVNTSADRAVRLSVRGPIVADEDFRSYTIRITPNERVLTLTKGYLNVSFDNITLGNNIPSYDQFVHALDLANMMSGTELSGSNNDTRGVCAQGRLYEFQIFKADQTVKSLWATSCSGYSGSETGSVSTLLELFKDQIPGASLKIGNLWR